MQTKLLTKFRTCLIKPILSISKSDHRANDCVWFRNGMPLPVSCQGCRPHSNPACCQAFKRGTFLRNQFITQLALMVGRVTSDIWISELGLMLCSKSQPCECHFHCASCVMDFPLTIMMRIHCMCLSCCSFHDAASCVASSIELADQPRTPTQCTQMLKPTTPA